jgi:hypothetical protein
MNFGIKHSDHLPKDFQITNNPIQRRVVITGQYHFSYAFHYVKHLFRTKTLLMQKADYFVHALAIHKVGIIEGHSG